MKSKIINDITEYIDAVNAYRVKGKSLSSMEYIKIFRGVSCVDYDYVPALARPLSDKRSVINTPLMLEDVMIQKAMLRMPEILTDQILPIRTITKLQHFGLPTRLLDFTTNALVALFFACQVTSRKNLNKDGKVLMCFENHIQSCYSPKINAIADMRQYSPWTTTPIQSYLEYLETKAYWRFSKAELENKFSIIDDLRFPVFFYSEASTERIRRQQGLFLLFPTLIGPDPYFNESEEHKHLCLSDKLTEWNPTEATELIIPSKAKSKLVRDLGNLGINKSFLFPEPDRICEDIFNEATDYMQSFGSNSDFDE